jgi:hypothetical protein
MLQWADEDSKPDGEGVPKTLWEAVTTIARVRDQYDLAAKRRDLARLKHLRGEQTLAWSYVRDFAGRLEAKGQAPEGLVARLRDKLQIDPQREQDLDEAIMRLRDRTRLEALQLEVQEELQELPLAA